MALCVRCRRGTFLEEGTVPGEDGIAENRDEEAGEAEKAAEGEAGGGTGAAGGDEGDAEHGSEHDAEEEGENGGPEAEEGGDHGEHLDVAEAEAVALAEGFVGPADEQEDEARLRRQRRGGRR